MRKILKERAEIIIAALALTFLIVQDVLMLFGTADTRHALHQTDQTIAVSREQLQTSRDTEIRQLRAYLGYSAYSLHMRCDACTGNVVGGQPKLKIEAGRNVLEFDIKNFGVTPATRPSYCGTLAEDSATTGDFDRFFGHCQPMYGGTIRPGEVKTYTIPLGPADVSVLNAARSGQLRLTFFARISYQDVFGIDRWAWLTAGYQFAAVISPKTNKPLKGVGAEYWVMTAMTPKYPDN